MNENNLFQIDFLVWHITKKCYLYGLSTIMLENSKQGVYKADFIGMDGCTYTENGEDLIFEPFINETDKNKNKIYLNSVVLIPEGWSGDYHYNKAFGVVKYDDGGFYVESRNNSDYTWEDLEVVGTTHTFNEDILRAL